MRSKKKYTAAIIGTGRIGFALGFDKKREQPASHTAALLKNPRIRIIAGCDTDAEKLAAWKRCCRGAASYHTASYLFAACSPDIVVAAVNESAHVEVALEAIRSKPKLLILEKPVALCMKDGLAIADEAKKYGVPVLVNHERRFADDYAAAKSYIKKIGAVQRVRAELCSGLRVYGKKYEASGEYSLFHDGTHLVDIVQYLLSDDSNSAETEKRRSVLYNMSITGIHRDESDPSIVQNLSAHFASDVCSDITLTMSGRSRFFSFGVDILGTEGAVAIGNGYAKFYRREKAKLYTGFYSLAEDKKVSAPKKTRCFSNMVKGCVDFLDGIAPLKSTLEDGLQTLDILERIRAELCA